MHKYLQLQIDNICTVHSTGYKKFRSVEIFKLSLTIYEISFYIYLFLTVCENV